jgi:hypothetical protein
LSLDRFAVRRRKPPEVLAMASIRPVTMATIQHVGLVLMNVPALF